jgi:hypothetical protein
MQLLNASLLIEGTVSTRNNIFTKVDTKGITVVLPRTKVLVEGSCSIKHSVLYDE